MKGYRALQSVGFAAAITAVACAMPARGAYVILDTGNRVDCETINYNSGRKEYALTDDIGAVVRQPARKVVDLSVPAPAGLDKARAMLNDATKYAVLIPALEKVVAEYRGLKWDVRAAAYLSQIYVRQGKVKEAIALSDKVFQHSKPRWVPAAYSRMYLDLLVKDNQLAAVRKRVDKMMQSGHAPTLAIACLVRGDILMAEGKFKPALLEGYFRTAVIYRDVRSVQPEALAKIVRCLEGLRDPRADKMRQRLIEKYPTSKWALEMGG